MMNRTASLALSIALLVIGVLSVQAQDGAKSIDLWTAAAQGNLEELKRHVSAGADLNAKAPDTGVIPLVAAALFDRKKASGLLIEKGADVNAQSKDGGTPLHAAAFFCRAEIVKLLLEKGAKVSVRNNSGHTPLETVEWAWSPELEGAYKGAAEFLKIQLDLEKVKAARPKLAALLREHNDRARTGMAMMPAGLLGSDARKGRGYKFSYYANGEIHINELGAPEAKPLTTGHWDFKPSWSKTGDMLVFFRRVKDDPVTVNWKTEICVIKVDGTGFHKLTDATQTNFNQTWTRDGTNTPIWNRKNPATGSFFVMRSKVGAKPGQEVALTDKSHHTWAYTCLIDGRILVQSAPPNQGWGYFLMTPKDGGQSTFERLDCELAKKGILDRVSLSPSETRVCFEFQTGYKYKDPGRTLYFADFDAKKRSITNAKPFANEEGANRWFAYPRWTKDEKAIVYHASPSLYLYTLEDGSTTKVSTNAGADYRYPHGEATPK